MKALFFLSLFTLLGNSNGFDVGLISRYVPSAFTETAPFSPTAIDGAIALKNARLFLNELLLSGNYTTDSETFMVNDKNIPVIINNWEYYWSPAFHPLLQNGSHGCKIPMKWLVEVSEKMENFRFRTQTSNDPIVVSIGSFLKAIRFNDNEKPTEMAWSCIDPMSRCCGIGCCSKELKQPQSIFHSVFNWMCGGFMFLCCLILLLSLVMFLCNDVWHRYIPWFPTSPRPPATPRGEDHEMQELNPASHRSPSRMHLAA